ncbi:MAG TPA: UPF0158 family protein, partial [Actinomycetota bacterium]|nr:UPF0158 family protein [Actinomycetota bacterium]
MLELDRIDLSSLCEALEDHSEWTTWYFDPATGSVEPRSEDDVIDPTEDEGGQEDLAADGDLVAIDPVPSREGYRDMEDFIAGVRDARARDLLDRAIAGRGAFRRFKDTLFEFPELRARWFEFHDLRMRVRAIEWLAWNEYVERAAADRAIEELERQAAPEEGEPGAALHPWHPQPELLGFRDPGAARGPLEALGHATWGTALEFLFDEAMRRSIGTGPYPEIRRMYFGDSAEPGPAPNDPSTSTEVLSEFRERIAPWMLNAQNPRSLPYFTPPALPISIAGETLAQWTNQGVDIWSCSPVGSLVEEEVVRWLCDLVGYGRGSFGVLTSGGVMANLMAMTVARDIHLAALLGLP